MKKYFAVCNSSKFAIHLAAKKLNAVSASSTTSLVLPAQTDSYLGVDLKGVSSPQYRDAPPGRDGDYPLPSGNLIVSNMVF